MGAPIPGWDAITRPFTARLRESLGIEESEMLYGLRFWFSRRHRMRDFERRARHAPDSVLTLGAWRYIPVHPFADDQELLATLELDPDDCATVDAYWSDGSDVYFFQVWPTSLDPMARSGFFYRWDSDRNGYVFAVIIDPEPVTRVLFESFMSEVARRLPPPDRPDGLRPLPVPETG